MASRWGLSWSTHWGVSWDYFTPVVVIGGGRYKSTWQKGVEELRKREVFIPPLNSLQKAAAHMSSLGGHARAKALSATARTAIATKAANIRWK